MHILSTRFSYFDPEERRASSSLAPGELEWCVRGNSRVGKGTECSQLIRRDRLSELARSCADYVSKRRHRKAGDRACMHDSGSRTDRSKIGIAFLVVARFNSQNDEIHAFGRRRNSTHVRPAQHVLTGRRKKHVEAPNFRVASLRSTFFQRERRLGEQIALRGNLLTRIYKLPPAFQSAGSIVGNACRQ